MYTRTYIIAEGLPGSQAHKAGALVLTIKTAGHYLAYLLKIEYFFLFFVYKTRVIYTKFSSRYVIKEEITGSRLYLRTRSVR